MSGSLEQHHPAKLALYHQNPRVGDTAAIAGSLRANGQYRPIVVNRGTHTDRPMEVLAGNHTLKAIRDLAQADPMDDRWQNVDCWVIDVDDDRATRIVLADNKTADLGFVDDDLLLPLLESLGDVEGTAYTDEEYDALVRAVGTAGDDAAAMIGEFLGGDDDDLDDADDDPDDDDPDDADVPAVDDEADQWVPITYSVTLPERATIRDAVSLAMKKNNLPTSAHGIVHIANAYLEAQR